MIVALRCSPVSRRASSANVHQRTGALIANLAADACVEVPCLVDGAGVWPVRGGRAAAAVRGLHRPRRSIPRRSRCARRSTRTATPSTTPCMQDPQVQARLDARRGVAPHRRAHRRRGGVAARLAAGRGLGSRHPERGDIPDGDESRDALRRIGRSRRPDRPCTLADRRVRLGDDEARDAPAASDAAGVGRSAATGGARRWPAASGRCRAQPARSTTPSGATRRSSPARSRSSTPSGRPPGHHGRGHGLRLGRLLGQAPDRASPAATRPTCSRWTARSSPTTSRATCSWTSQPFIERDGFDLDRARRRGRRPLHDARRRPVRPAARPQRRRRSTTTRPCSTRPASRTRTTPGPGTSSSRSGKQLTLDADGDGQPEQWGFYTETTDMENYWSSLVWQNGGDIVSEDRTQTAARLRRGRRWLQFLQDLIYTHKIMPTPDCSRSSVTRSSRAWRPWSRTARGWCRRTSPPASTWASRRCRPVRPARPPASTPRASSSPASTDNPDAAWEFVKYLVGPEAQTQLMQLKAAVPVDKSVLAGSYSDAFPGSRRVRRDRSSTPTSSRPSAGYNEWTTMLQEELDANVFNAPNKTAREAIDTRAAGSWTRSSRRRSSSRRRRADPDERADRGPPASRARPRPGRDPPDRRGRRGGPLASERRWAWLFLAPTLVGPRRAVGRAHPRHAGHQPHRLGPADAARRGSGLDNFRDLLVRRPASGWRSATPPSTRSCRCPLGMVLALALALGLDQAHPRHRLDPHHVLPAARHLGGRGGPRVALDLRPARAACSTSSSAMFGIPPQRWVSDPFWAMPAIIAMSVWQGLGRQHHHLPRGAPGDPDRVPRRGQRGRRRPLGRASAASPCRC